MSEAPYTEMKLRPRQPLTEAEERSHAEAAVSIDATVK